MEIQDFGTLSGSVLLYGGPYSNLAATRALLSVAETNGIARSNRICTGDIVAYGADATEVWQEVSARGGRVIAGNCEQQLAARAEGCGCGFEAGTTCDLLSKGWYDHARAVLPEAALQWMGQVPDIGVFRHAGRRVAVIHGGVTDVSRFVWPSSDVGVFDQEINALVAKVGAVDVVVAGHCGIAFQRQIGDVLWLNAGAIGLPPHDGRAETRFAMLDPKGRIMIERLSYNPAPTVASMARAGLTQGYHATMTSGVWPSEDVLPTELRRDG
ncbi:metallophosphoesterase family protein [Tropicimonas sp. S265A]|uniref:metallophosphoesterase family protein n=1 Tax=Tropicimonas sp. S265A TaxID=3415134 RepID=UPI003C7C65B4